MRVVRPDSVIVDALQPDGFVEDVLLAEYTPCVQGQAYGCVHHRGGDPGALVDFDDPGDTRVSEELGSTGQHVELVALNVDLDENGMLEWADNGWVGGKDDIVESMGLGCAYLPVFGLDGIPGGRGLASASAGTTCIDEATVDVG
jgi:hypothetical protein